MAWLNDKPEARQSEAFEKNFVLWLSLLFLFFIIVFFTGFLHDFGIIHRDVKVREGGNSLVCDQIDRLFILINGTKYKQMYFFITNIVDNISPC